MYTEKSFIKLLLSFAITIILLFAGVNVSASISDKLYESQIDVPNRSLEARKVALRVGLMKIILRATGDSGVLDIPEVDKMFDSPEKYLQSYGYSDSNGGLVIKMIFHEKQINKKLRELDINPWVKRPEILVWVFINGQSIGSLSPEESQRITNKLIHISSEVGLPISLPLWDLQEEQSFSYPSNIQSQELIEKLSKKYAREVVLVCDIRQVLDDWNIVWTIYTQAETQHWVSKGDSIEYILETGLKDVTSLLRERFHLATSYGVSKIKLSVRNISSSKDYERVQKYLSKLSIVDSVKIVSLQRKDVTFQLEITQSVNKFKEILELNEQLTLINDINYEHLIYNYKP